MAKITEKVILEVPRISIVEDGNQFGEIRVPDNSLFRVGQIVFMQSSTQQLAEFKVNRILGKTVLLLGRINLPVKDRVDLSGFKVIDGTTIGAREQLRPNIPSQEISRYTYEEEPVSAQRSILVDKNGERIAEENPLPVNSVGDKGLVPATYDSVDLNRNLDKDIDTVEFKKEDVVVRKLKLTYDLDGDLIKVGKV